MNNDQNFLKYFQKAEFLISVPSTSLLPEDNGAEVVFLGRSNTGKSSTINSLCSRRKLAHTSRTPGRTQQFNCFSLDKGQRLVDVPGFGYAKVSKAIKSRWERELPIYLQYRKSLRGIVLIMDIRNPLTDIEKSILNWSSEACLPSIVLLNKSDKTKKNYNIQICSMVNDYFVEIGKNSENNVIIFSAKYRHGISRLASLLALWLDID